MPQQPSAPLSDFLREEDIFLPLRADSAEDAIRQLVRHIHKLHGGFDCDSAVEAVLARESVMPVVIGRELTMPHARLKELTKPRMVIGVAPDGIPFPATTVPMKIIILTLAPCNDPNIYLRVLAAVSKALRDPQVTEKMIHSETAGEVLAALSLKREHMPDFIAVHHMMDTSPVVLTDKSTLRDAIELFCGKSLTDLPVVDQNSNVLGSIAIEDLLRQCLPAHLRWMEDLSPILRFEPFADLVKKECDQPITRFMREDVLSIAPNTPAVQLAKLFLLDERRQVLVMEDRHLVGVVDLSSYVRKLFWD